ncbi:DinB family protein [Kribbella lupini]|uniref:DinB family protein n=1 Tax=Kribbella lupini TaxID=291602 RepID=A0ABP4MY53_9ACTN
MTITGVLRGQFELTWSLFEYHLDRLVPEDLLWEPAGPTWTVRPDAAGIWRPDWADEELDPIPVPTVGWLTWHIGWWWTTALAHARQTVPPHRTDVPWPGTLLGTRDWMHHLRDEWSVVLEDSSRLTLPVAFPWPPEAGRTVADLYGWVNAELMKNAAEIGQLRLLRAAELSTAS